VKHKRVLISLISVAVSTQVVGIFSNHVVMSLNKGMPVLGLAASFGKWVPFDQGTKLPLLTDVIRVGMYYGSIGDLFIVIGLVTCMTAIWIAMPQGRKFFPLLVASTLGIFWSESQVNNVTTTFLCVTAGVGTILAIYWKYRSSNKSKAMVKEADE
jgi:hypothetical protein